MKIISIEISDFLSIDRLTLRFDEPHGLVLVTGANGSGKSAIVAESLYWGLYGKTLRGLTASAVVRSGCKQAEVCVYLEVRGRSVHVVRRAASAGGRNLRPLEIWCGGEDIAAATKRDAQGQLDELLPVSADVFRTIFLLSEGFEWSFTRWGKRERAELIEKLVGFDQLDGALQRCKDEYRGLQGKLSLAKERIASVERHRRDLTLINEASKQERELRVAAHDKRIDQIQADIDALAKAQPACPGRGDGADDPTKARTARAEVQARLNELIGGISHLTSVRNQIAGLEDAAQCPICRQDVPPTHIKDTLISIDCELEQYTGLRVGVEERLSAASKVVEQIAARADAHAEWTRQRDNRQRELDREVQLRRQAAVEKPGATAEVLERSSREIEEALASFTSLNDELPYVEFWTKGLSHAGLRSYRLDGVLDWINQRLVAYCGVLYDDGVVISLVPEAQLKSRDAKVNGIQVLVSSLPGGQYEAASRGQRRKIDLAVHLALQDLALHTSGIRTNVMVADEVLDSLDDDAARRAVSLLAERAKDIGTVLLISHEDQAVRSRVGRVWTVVADDGVSRLEVGDA